MCLQMTPGSSLYVKDPDKPQKQSSGAQGTVFGSLASRFKSCIRRPTFCRLTVLRNINSLSAAVPTPAQLWNGTPTMEGPTAALALVPRSCKMERCYLLDLPPELRTLIYEALYAIRCRCYISVYRLKTTRSWICNGGLECSWSRGMKNDRDQASARECLRKHATLPNVLYACRLIAREASPILYDRALEFSIRFRQTGPMNHSPWWLTAPRCAFAHQNRRLVLHLRAFCHEDVADVVGRIQLFFRRLQPGEKLKIIRAYVELRNVATVRDADPIYDALWRLPLTQLFPIFVSLEKLRPRKTEYAEYEFRIEN